MSGTLRGEPTLDEVLPVIERVWRAVPEVSLATVIGNACASFGLVGHDLGDAIFMRWITDRDLLSGLHYWMWMSRGDIAGNCPVCGLPLREGEHPWVNRPVLVGKTA